MHKLGASIYKEFLLISRDFGGMVILFVMPLVLVITVTLIQDSSFQNSNGVSISLALIDHDKGEVAQKIREDLNGQKNLKVIQAQDTTKVKKQVNNGEFKMAIVIPANLTVSLDEKVENNVNRVLSQVGIAEDKPINNIASKKIKLYFDPAVSHNFKQSVKNNIEKMVSEIETKSIYNSFEEKISSEGKKIEFDTKDFIVFQEISPSKGLSIKPNSVQHNVPAWTLFAIFFIIVPLSINMVKEKNQGTFIRQRTQPISYFTILGGKGIIYLIVSLIQFTLMLLIGLYLFPVLGLPAINIAGRLSGLYIVALVAGSAAVGLGLLIGTFSSTPEQSAPFGATLVIIMAATGGVWVPVFAMPKIMQTIAKASPMNWGLEAFYHVFLRDSQWMEILPYLGLLLLFAAITSTIAIIYNEKKIHL